MSRQKTPLSPEMLFTVYEEEPDGLAGAVEGGEVGDVVGVGGDEHHVRGVRVAPGLEEGEVRQQQ